MVKCLIDGSFHGSNDIKFNVLVIEYSLGHTDGKLLDYNEGINI